MGAVSHETHPTGLEGERERGGERDGREKGKVREQGIKKGKDRKNLLGIQTKRQAIKQGNSNMSQISSIFKRR